MKYQVDVPVLDQWELVLLLEKSYEGTLTFNDFWKQHNEHRLLFPLLIMIVLARLTHWNITYELITGIAIATLTCCVLLYQVYRTDRLTGSKHGFWLFPLVSVVVFSLNQVQNWLWGWQIQMHLVVFAAALSIILLSNFSSNRWLFCLSMFLGIVGTYSFANGMLVWLTGLGVLLFSRKLDKSVKSRRIIVWLVVSIFVIASYLYHYKKPEYHPSLLFLFKNPTVFLKYVFSYLGGPIGFQKVSYSVSFGVFVFVMLIFLVFFLIKRRKVGSDFLLPYIGLSLFSIMSAAITGVGRCGFGCDQALSSRYITIVVLLWVSVVVLLYLVVVTRPTKVSNKVKGKGLSVVAIGLILAILILDVSNSFYAMDAYKIHKRFFTHLKDVLYAGAERPEIKYLYPWPDLLFQRREILKKYDLSVFHNPPAHRRTPQKAD
jgi:hypothetical protein